MAMVTCKECGKRVSNSKKACKYCGAKIKKKTSIGRIIATTFAFLVFMGFMVPLIINTMRGQGLLSPAEVASDTQSIPAEKFYYFSFDLRRPSKLSVEVEKLSGPNVDVYFLTDSAYKTFEQNTRMIRGTPVKAPFQSTLSKEGLAGKFESNPKQLGKGRYHLIIDNSSYGPTSPGGASARVSYTILAQ
ncbi:MAG: hypothetical protein AAGB26_01050 [Planctomycetota bacterium]